MRNTAAIHERFMNASRIILPRVGVGGGVGGRGGGGLGGSIQDQTTNLTLGGAFIGFGAEL